MSYLRFDKTLMTNLEEVSAERNPPDEQRQELIIVQRLLIVTHANIMDYW